MSESKRIFSILTEDTFNGGKRAKVSRTMKRGDTEVPFFTRAMIRLLTATIMKFSDVLAGDDVEATLRVLNVIAVDMNPKFNGKAMCMDALLVDKTSGEEVALCDLYPDSAVLKTWVTEYPDLEKASEATF